MFDWNLVVECILNEGCDHQILQISKIPNLLFFEFWMLTGREAAKAQEGGCFPYMAAILAGGGFGVNR